MKPLLTVFLSLSWVALISTNAIAREENSQLVAQSRPNLTNNRGMSPAEQLKPIQRSQPAEDTNTIELANQRLERKSFRRGTNQAQGEDQPWLVEPLCLDSCLPDLGPIDNPPGGVGVVWPVNF